MSNCDIRTFNNETLEMYYYGKKELETRGYTVGKCIGQGAFGKTFILNKGGKKYVMKMIRDDHEEGYSYHAVKMEINIYREFKQYCDKGRDDILCLYEEFVAHYKDGSLSATPKPVRGPSPDNPNGGKIYNEYIYIVFNAFENMNLSDYLEKNKNQISQADKENIMHSLCKNMKFLHSKGVTHKDIKPDNIMINSRTKQCYMIDYGLSCLFSDPNYKACKYSIAGSPIYMSPEVTAGKENKERYDNLDRELYAKVIDLWSLGCVFYKVLVGEELMYDLISHMSSLGVKRGDIDNLNYNFGTRDGVDLIKSILLTQVIEPPSRSAVFRKFKKFIKETKSLFKDVKSNMVLEKKTLVDKAPKLFKANINYDHIDSLNNFFNKRILGLDLTELLYVDPTGRNLDLFRERKATKLLLSSERLIQLIGDKYIQDFYDDNDFDALMSTQSELTKTGSSQAILSRIRGYLSKLKNKTRRPVFSGVPNSNRQPLLNNNRNQNQSPLRIVPPANKRSCDKPPETEFFDWRKVNPRRAPPTKGRRLRGEFCDKYLWIPVRKRETTRLSRTHRSNMTGGRKNKRTKKRNYLKKKTALKKNLRKKNIKRKSNKKK